MKQLLLYSHAGSANRGCEAIVRSSVEIIRKAGYTSDISLFTSCPEEDIAVDLDKIVKLHKSPTRSIADIPLLLRASASIYNHLFHSERLYYLLTAQPFNNYVFKDTIALSIGGDHYCYKGSEQILAFHNTKVKKGHGTSVLWGCSVEQNVLDMPSVKEDMSRYDLIIAREHISYDSLKSIGLNNVILRPDPAFTLPYIENSLSQQVSPNTVGINFSPYANGTNNIGLKNYQQLINWILNNTDMNILLIPHVFKSHSHDVEQMKLLLKILPSSPRIKLIEKKLSACEIKAIIRRCRFFIGTRTHSTIAAYSTFVPTLVIGYSIKALGIAEDIFGNNENYVIPVDSFKNEQRLTEAFQWMLMNENSIRAHLSSFMPSYIGAAYQMGYDILNLVQ